MSKGIQAGIDFGSGGFRVGWSGAEGLVHLDAPGDGLQLQWSVPDPTMAPSRVRPFSSVKKMLGETGIPGTNPQEIVRARLQDIRTRIEEVGGPVETVTIAIPALYPEKRRAALREAALQAGFGNVRLLNDTLAAVIGQLSAPTQPATMLVLSMGRSGFEAGLVRVTEGRVQALAYEGADEPSGNLFDLTILTGICHWLEAEGLFPSGYDLDSSDWLTLRSAAEGLKEELSFQPRATRRFLWTIEDREESLSLTFDTHEFERRIEPCVSESLTAVEELLDESNLRPSDLDQLLLVGGSMRIPLIQRLTSERFSVPIQSLDEFSVLAGAVFDSAKSLPRRAAGLLESPRRMHLTTLPDPARITASMGDPGNNGQSAPPVPTLRAKRTAGGSQTAAGRNSPADVATQREAVFRYARHLVDSGSREQARGFLEGLVQDAEALLAVLPAAPSGRAGYMLKRGYELLEEGRYQLAVQHSHAAHQLNPEDPEVFERMIDIHLRAALAHSSPPGYAKSLEWLNCALSHDRTNQRIHEQIAARHYQHAVEMLRLERPEEATLALEECLNFNPRHEEAQTLAAQLRRSRDPRADES